MFRVLIHGESGTTGLRLKSRISARRDIQLEHLPESKRKDPEAAAEILNECDLVFLCLPDIAAKEAAASVHNPNTVVIDTSTAHRTDPSWVYGFPELAKEQPEKIRNARRISVPGCHASGFIALVAPLVRMKIIPASALLTCFSLTGYSGGGKKMISEYESSDRPRVFQAPRQYGLNQQHKHLPEMQKMAMLQTAPVFSPIVSDFYSGMEVTVPLFRDQLSDGISAYDVCKTLEKAYPGPVVRFVSDLNESGFASANAMQGLDSMEITVAGNEERILLIARYDNLGKGASGAAVQCMNLVLGCEMTLGLDL